MSGPGPAASLAPSFPDQVASLRHDLVNPISQVVGYSELLMAEASDHGLASIVPSLGSIRRIAFALLGKIDLVLLRDPASPTVDDLRRLGEDLLGPALLLVREADALLGTLNPGEARGALADDLDKVRAAGAQLVVLIELLEAGAVADA